MPDYNYSLFSNLEFRRAIRAARRFDRDVSEAMWALFRVGGSRLRCPFHTIDLTHQQEDSESHDDEIDDGVDEQTIVDCDGSGGFCIIQCLGCRPGKRDEEIGEVHLPQ